MNPDIFKLMVVSLAFIYFNIKVKPRINKTNYWIMNVGLCLLLLASILDYTDGFKALNYVVVLGKKAPWHDLIEDQLLDTPGIALFIFGVFREMIKRRAA